MNKLLFLVLFILSSSFIYSQNHSKTIDEALLIAKKENKNVFINFFYSDCKLNQKMKKEMKNDIVQSVLKSNYIIVDIEIKKDETFNYLNCTNPVKSFSTNNCEEVKLPFFYILDEFGSFTYNSFKKDNSNIGYPTSEKDMDSFVELIGKKPRYKSNLIIDSFNKVALN